MKCRSMFLRSLIAMIATTTPLFAQEHVASGHAETLLKATESWNGKAYTQYPAGQPQLTMLRVTIDAQTALPWHHHPIPNVGYVLSGELTITDQATGRSRHSNKAKLSLRVSTTSTVGWPAHNRRRSCWFTPALLAQQLRSRRRVTRRNIR